MCILAVENLQQHSERFRGSLEKCSDFLGLTVHKGIYTKTLQLKDFVVEELKLRYLLNKNGPGYQLLTSLLPRGHTVTENGTVVVKSSAENYQWVYFLYISV